MTKTVTLVTNQYACDRIIYAARSVADRTGSELIVVGILDSEYALDPQVIDYLFNLSKQNKATMRLVFTENKLFALRDTLGQFDCRYVVTGMPSANNSVLYSLWKDFPGKRFYTVDTTGEVIDVATPSFCIA